jgi:hypothetical protein
MLRSGELTPPPATAASLPPAKVGVKKGA